MLNVINLLRTRGNGYKIVEQLRFCSKKDKTKGPITDKYVYRVRHLDYWLQSDNALEMEFNRGKFMLMVDKEPLVTNAAKLKYNEKNKEDKFSIEHVPELATFDYQELTNKLREYGFEIGHLNSALLDIIDPSENYHDYVCLLSCKY